MNEDDKRFINGITVDHHAKVIFNMLADYGEKNRVHPFVLISAGSAAISKVSYEFIEQSEVEYD